MEDVLLPFAQNPDGYPLTGDRAFDKVILQLRAVGNFNRIDGEQEIPFLHAAVTRRSIGFRDCYPPPSPYPHRCQRCSKL